jgi:hypothetical protein
MTKRTVKFNVVVIAVLLAVIMTGCAVGNTNKGKSPELGPPSILEGIFQDLFNAAPLKIAGKNVNIRVGGGTWIGYVDGKAFNAGGLETYVMVDANWEPILDADGSKDLRVALTQTHLYSTQQNPVTKKDIGWIKTPAPALFLRYTKEPPSMKPE